MNIKSDSKISNKWFSIIIIFVICISAVSITGIFSDLLNNETNNSNHNEGNLKIPRAAGHNTLLFITGISQSHTARGSNFILNGYTQKFQTGFGFVNTSGIPVYPILDGHLCDGSDSNSVLYPNLTVLSSFQNTYEGQFSISITVQDDYDYTSDLEVLANITEIISQSIFVDSYTINETQLIYHDITTPTALTLDTGTESDPVIPGDQFTLSMTFQDSTGTDLTSASDRFNVRTNGVVNGIYNISSSGGSGTVSIIEETGMTSVGVDFLGMISKTVGSETYYEYESSTQSAQIVRVESISGIINITNSNEITSNYLYTNGSFEISGYIWANENSTLKLSNRAIQIFLNDTYILTTTTGADGFISESFTLEELGVYDSDTNITITIQLVGYDSELYPNVGSFRVTSSSILIDDAPSIASLQRWWLILFPVLGIAALIAGIVIFQRKRMDAASKLDYRLRAVDKSTKFAIVTMLYSQGRKREAIAYTYKIYTDLIYEKYSLQRSVAQTLREFAIICVMKYGLDPHRVYPYISMIEDVIYGAYEVDRKIFDKSITLFGRIFQEITGVLLTFNLSISQHTNLEQVTLNVSLPEEQTKKIGEK